MHLNLFDYDCYKSFLKDWVLKHPNGSRGLYKKLSSDSNVPTVIISQTLSGKREFTLDQAFAVSEHIGVKSDNEWEYFKLLIEKEKVSNLVFKNKIQEKLKKMRAGFFKVASFSQDKRNLSNQFAKIYYSKVEYSLVRLAILIAGHEKNQMFKKLLNIGIGKEKANECLHALINMGLVELKNDKYYPTSLMVHIDKSSDLFKLYKKNLIDYLKTVLAKTHEEENIDYYSIAALDEQTSIQFKSDLLKLLKKYSNGIKKASSDEIHLLNIEYMRIL